MNARGLMVLGTASHVGKSIIAAGLCRALVKRGWRVAPFKAQNMSLNAAVTPAGGEIGRAQALQADACNLPARVEMNPVLLKPESHTGSQVVVLGRVWGRMSASEYFARRTRDLWPIIRRSYKALARDQDLVVLEGAGSPAEINLRRSDIVNMRMAHAADAACLLVGDIDRGGVFASILGTLQLLSPRDRQRIRGFVINKFRGDLRLLQPGITTIERKIRRPCLGVLPYVDDLQLDDEDSVSLDDAPGAVRWTTHQDSPSRPLRVAVIKLPHLANATDFAALEREPAVALAYVTRPSDLSRADLIILPGSKQTIPDLEWLFVQGLADAIRRFGTGGGCVVGICGGMQMLGHRVSDPERVEGGGTIRGLALLPIDTTLRSAKITELTIATRGGGTLFGAHVGPVSASGYEIHMGATSYRAGAQPFWTLSRGQQPKVRDGACNRGARIIGTYLHGLFDTRSFRHAFIKAARKCAQLDAPVFALDQRTSKLDRLAKEIERHLDVDRMLGWVGLESAGSRRARRR
jgi:adenosylcobyric acid synthase